VNRRKAIKRFLIIGGGVAGAYAGIKSYKTLRYPEFESLSKNQILISELADTILPGTANDPGAKDAKVGELIVKMVRDCTTRSSQNNFIEGIEDLISYTHDQFDKSFIECSAVQKKKVLLHFEQKGKPYSGILGKIQHRFLGDSFFTTLKKFTVLGFCTSQLGATKALRYDYIPGKYIGIVDLQSGDRSWATQ
jgi:hypothetical protein